MIRRQVFQDIRTAIFDLQADPDQSREPRSDLHATISGLTAGAPLRRTVRMSGPLHTVPADLAQHTEAVVRKP